MQPIISVAIVLLSCRLVSATAQADPGTDGSPDSIRVSPDRSGVQPKLGRDRASCISKDVLEGIKNDSFTHGFFNDYDSFHNKLTTTEAFLLGLYTITKYNEYVYTKRYYYSSHDEMRMAAGPQVDQQACIRHLTHIAQRARRDIDGDLNVAQLLDTFGHAPSGQLVGDLIWTGSYSV